MASVKLGLGSLNGVGVRVSQSHDPPPSTVARLPDDGVLDTAILESAVLGQVRREFLREGMMLTAAGVVIGLVAAAALTRLMSSLLFGVNRLDPLTYVLVTVVLVGVATLAVYLPAWRASRNDPIEALRCG